jgi:hypothetical protein
MPARFFVLVPILFSLLTSGMASAQDAINAAQAVIANQIKALMHGDADAAYALASPAIQSLYPDKRLFLTMVQKEYEPVYQAGTYAFGRSKQIGAGEVVLQEVLINSKQGADWTAIYEMRLMDDGSYKVNGVRMVRNTASQGI